MAALLLPVLALVVNAVRWGSQQRDRRLAALRLSGMSARQVRLVTGLEIGLAAAVGSVLGGMLFLGLRAVLTRWLPIGGGGYPLDASPPPAQAVAVVVGLPLLGTAIAIATLRRVVVNPLGVIRRVAVTRPTGWRFLPLVVGLGVLCWLWVTTRGTAEQSAGLLFLAGAVLVMLGLFVTAPAICLGVAAVLVRIERSPVLLLAARRAQASVGSSARVVGVVSLLVFTASWFLSVLPLTNPANAESLAQLGRRLQPHTFVSPVTQTPAPDQLALPGVTGVAELVQVQLRSADAPDGVAVVAADCAALARVLRAPLPDCTPSTTYLPQDEEGSPLADGGTFTAFLEGAETGQGIQRVDVGEVRLGQPVRGALDGLGDLAVGAALVPRSQVPDEALRAAKSRILLVSTSGEDDPVARERVRTAIQVLQAGSLREVRDIEELIADANAVGLGYQAAVWAGLGLTFVVSALSLAVALLDRLIEERRGVASLRAQGVTVPTLRLTMLGQTMLTLLPGALVGIAAAVPLALVFFAISGHPELSVPWSGLAATAVGCVLATLAVVALLLPSLNEVVDTGQLVAE